MQDTNVLLQVTAQDSHGADGKPLFILVGEKPTVTTTTSNQDENLYCTSLRWTESNVNENISLKEKSLTASGLLRNLMSGRSLSFFSFLKAFSHWKK